LFHKVHANLICNLYIACPLMSNNTKKVCIYLVHNLCFTTENLGSDVYTKSRATCALRQQYHQVCEWTWSTNGLFISCLWPLIHFFGVNLLSLFSKLDVFNAMQQVLFIFIIWSGLQKSWIYLHLMIPDNSNNIW
jgi:hypothetical protein